MRKSWFSKILILFVFMGIFLDSIYSCPNHKTVCKCNHNSKKEKHQKFKDTDCHKTVEGRHICKCKKEKSSDDSLSHYKQIKFLFSYTETFFIQFIYSKSFSQNQTSHNQGYTIKIIKPPKFFLGV